MCFGGELFQQRLKFSNETNDVRFGNELSIDLKSFCERNEMRRSEKPDAQSCRAINALQHRARRAFAIGSRDMNETKFVLWISRQRSKFEGVFQPQLRSKHPKLVEKLNGFGIVHEEI
jgi:hypothetical protein